jgi:murein DD-endopeptidase MepM/ murein hydrolase activator NlpD
LIQRLAGLLALALLSGAAPAWAQQRTAERLPNGEPVLRMPFAAGTVVLCQQGNDSPPGRSHHAVNCRHAIDWSDPSSDTPPIVLAAAAGRVAMVVDDAPPDDSSAGWGFGNLVKVDHGQGYFTLYAHLADVAVREGAQVRAGQPLGTLGATGNAGNPHLHFSLHRGDPTQPGAPATVPIHALIAADLTQDGQLELLCSLELIGAGARVGPGGHLYGSENSSSARRLGAPPDALQADFTRNAQRLRRYLGLAERVDLPGILQGWPERGGAWARTRLRERLSEHPDDLTASYYLAVASLEVADPDAAARALEAVLAAEPRDPGASTSWLWPWAHLRAGEVAEARGETEQARAHYHRALSYPEDGSGFRLLAEAGVLRLR